MTNPTDTNQASEAERNKRELEVLLSIPLNAHRHYIKGRISELREELGL